MSENENVENQSTEQVESIEPETTEPVVEAAPKEEAAPEIKSIDDIVKASKGTKVADKTVIAKDGVAVKQPINTYAPNFKFKVYDKEHEIDELFKGLIKDPESEKKVRELFEKAYGLDHVKPKYKKTKEEFQQLSSKHNEVMNLVTEVDGYLASGDYDSFFQKLGIPEKDVFKWVHDRLNFYEQPKEKQAEVEKFKMIQQQNKLLESQTKTYEQKLEELEAARHFDTLAKEISSPEVSSIAQVYNERVGDPQAFANVVRQRGYHIFQTEGRDPSEKEVVSIVAAEMAKLLNVSSQPVNQQVAPQNVAPPAKKVIMPDNSKKTMVNVKGSGSTAVEPIIKSLDDITREYKNHMSSKR